MQNYSSPPHTHCFLSAQCRLTLDAAGRGGGTLPYILGLFLYSPKLDGRNVFWSFLFAESLRTSGLNLCSREL